LKRILEPGEKLLSLSSEAILLRWFNFHLNNHGHHRTISNFTSDIKVGTYGKELKICRQDKEKLTIYLNFNFIPKDAENYAVLFAEIAPDTVTAESLVEAFKEKNFLTRAEMVLRWAAKLGCRKFVTPQDIVDVRD
jgi:plastin-1